MAEQELIPAAQYLRMSTEYQQYSIENQQAAIHEYALLNGFTIVQTYADPARSGVVLRGRTALIRLLEDVVRRRANYKAILVYDISRWGRFQDNDEAAYYEFLCKNCGIPIHYCVEPFRNDTSLPNMILKALKRAMAGEFSREHGRRTYQAQKQMVERGYKVGAPPGYGLRRMLVNADKSRNRILAAGEYKGISTDRIILVPGPAEELKTVRQIYGTYIHTNGWAGPKLIADELNRQGVPFVDGKRWDFNAVRGVLTNPKYAGWNVWGQTSQKLKPNSYIFQQSSG